MQSPSVMVGLQLLLVTMLSGPAAHAAMPGQALLAMAQHQAAPPPPPPPQPGSGDVIPVGATTPEAPADFAFPGDFAPTGAAPDVVFDEAPDHKSDDPNRDKPGPNSETQERPKADNCPASPRPKAR